MRKIINKGLFLAFSAGGFVQTNQLSLNSEKRLRLPVAGIIRKGLAIWTLLLPFFCLSGQYENITFQFDRILFQNFTDTLEKRIPIKLYYSDKWTDTLTISVNSVNATFREILDKSLRKYGFSFIVTDDNKVILSKGYSIKTNFSQEYLDHIRRELVKNDTSGFIQPAAREAKSGISDEFRLFKIGRQISGRKNQDAVLSGNIVNAADGKYMSGVVVYIEKLKAGVMTNDAGYYSITVPPGQYQLEFRMLGMKTTRRNVIIYSGGILDIEMEESTSELGTVTVTGSRSNIKDVRTGIVKIDSKMLKQMPMGLGEADVLKSSLLLPGVQTVGEASAGFSVRGGSMDQNLIYLNNAPILNPSHFFGFFSAFNSDLISDVTLYKSGMPAKFGGRLSSVMEIIPSEGNNEKVKINGGISPVTGRLTIEGPVGKSKSTFILGTRATYSDWLLRMLKDYRLSHSTAGFYDIQGLVKTDINEKNSISLSGYFSNDKFNYYSERAFDYGSLAATLKWTHTFSKKLSAKFHLITSNYRYRLDLSEDSTRSSTMNYKIDQKILRADFQYFYSPKHKIEFGSEATLYTLKPGIVKPSGIYSTIMPKSLTKESALEPSLYLSDEIEVTPMISVSAGIRSTFFTSFGPGTEFRYREGSPRIVENITDTISYKGWEIIKIYPGLDYRISSRFIIAPRLSLKIGAQRTHQYLHMISNTVSMSPTDTWKLSNNSFRPQRSDQVSLGLYHTFGKKAVEISAEVYYKKLRNILDYKSGAVLTMNEHLETDVINGSGKAYGIELLISKQTGSLNGWIGYTYSRTFLRTNSLFEAESVNGGRYYPADYDKPHDLKIIINSKISRRFNVTGNFMYNTGRPVTYPVAFYQFNNGSHVYFSNRNEFRIPDYIRLDLAATFNGNLRVRKLNHSSVTFAVYNVLGRKNPYSVFFRTEEGLIKGYQMTIFGRPIFMVSYNFRILGNASGDF